MLSSLFVIKRRRMRRIIPCCSVVLLVVVFVVVDFMSRRRISKLEDPLLDDDPFVDVEFLDPLKLLLLPLLPFPFPDLEMSSSGFSQANSGTRQTKMSSWEKMLLAVVTAIVCVRSMRVRKRW